MNLGALDNAALATELRRVLGTDIGLSYTQPQLAGGVRTSATNYAVFLRKILNNQLKIAALLGSNATCTNPATCATAVSTPVPNTLSWSYSMGHWVETDPSSGDGSFSSAGAPSASTPGWMPPRPGTASSRGWTWAAAASSRPPAVP